MLHFHVIANAHLDPVWLWDWKEGLNEGLVTCRTVLDLMDAYPELTFIRGEAAIYEHIERHDRETFARIRAHVATKRWDVVGGTYVQPDTNLPSTEVLVRHFQRGLGYFKRTFDVRPTVAWAPDSFGHSAGWPEIYRAAGMQSFAFSRPFAADLTLPSPAFWWEGGGGSRVLAWRMPIGWYGSTRVEVTDRLDHYLREAPRWGVKNIPIFFGLGNHGGGPSRVQIEAILRWRDRHPDVAVDFSTLHRFFDALKTEADSLPVFRGELNFSLRGCYASASAFKFAYRRTENSLLRAERTASIIAAVVKTPARPVLSDAWDALLFNTFHDVLPGTSIERAFIDQQAWLGIAYHQAQRAELDALLDLASRIDTRVPAPKGDRPSLVPVLVWNSQPVPFEGPVEFEVPLDYRPLDAFRHRPDEVPLVVRDAQGRALPFQSVETENEFAQEVPWRKRFVVRLKIPASGWHVITAGWATGKSRKETASDLRVDRGHIANAQWSVRAAAKAAAIVFRQSGARAALTLRVLTLDDQWGSWGGHDGEIEANHVNRVKAEWKIETVKLLERGPERASLWVRWRQGASWLELTIQLHRHDPAVVVRSRVFWAEKAARMKIVFSCGGEAEFEVPGGSVRRGPGGEVPGGRWVKVGQDPRGFVFASDALYNFDLTDDAFGATVVRSCRYAAQTPSTPEERPWRPYMDLGEHHFQFALAPGDADGAALARRLETPPVAMIVPAGAGVLARAGGLLQLSEGVQLLAFFPATTKDGWLLRLHNISGAAHDVTAILGGVMIPLGSVGAGRIHSVFLQRKGADWRAVPVNCAEEPILPRGNS